MSLRSFLFLITTLISTNVSASTNKLHIIQMGDLHSHFLSHSSWGGDDNPFVNRGGAAYIKTAIDEFIKNNNLSPDEVLIVDSGDWSEGSSFYKDGLGSTSLRMLDLLGVEVSVLGNHDFLNGPAVLKNVLALTNDRSFPVLAANLKYNNTFAAQLPDRVPAEFKLYKTFFASTEVMAFFTRLFLTFTTVPNDIDEAGFQVKLAEFLTWLRDPTPQKPPTPWFRRLEKHRLVNVMSLVEFTDSNKITPERDLELQQKLWGFWNNLKKKYPGIDINGFILGRPLLETSYLIPKNGFNICLFGLVTHEQVYQHFISPVKIEVPYPVMDGGTNQSIAQVVVKNLKASGACDIIAALTHQTDENDRILAEKVEGIDFILGGHSHNLINPPLIIINKKSKKGVPIFKAGKHGEVLATSTITINRTEDALSASSPSSIEFGDFNNIEVRPENLQFTDGFKLNKKVDDFINASITRIAELEGRDPFTTKVIDAEVSLERHVTAESTVTDFITTSIRSALENVTPFIADVDMVLISPFFISSDLQRGAIYEADAFSLLSLIYKADTNRSWNIFTVDIEGKSLRAILKLIFAEGMFIVPDERASISYDPAKVLDPFIDLYILNPETNERISIDDSKTYRIALPEGIVEAIDELTNVLPEISFENKQDSGIELWEALALNLKAHNGLKSDDIKLGGRLASVSADLSLSRKDLSVTPSNYPMPGVGGAIDLGTGEEFIVTPEDATRIKSKMGAHINIKVLNNGWLQSPGGELDLLIDSTPSNVFDNGATTGMPIKPKFSSADNEDEVQRRLEKYGFDLQLFNHWETLNSLRLIATQELPRIDAGKYYEASFDISFKDKDIKPGIYPILLAAKLHEDEEGILENNRVEGLLTVP